MDPQVKKDPTYIAGAGSKAAERLVLQHRIFSPGTKRLLEMSGFRPDMQVLIVGSGGGDETCLVAEALKGSGHITAIDKSEEQTKETQKAVNKASFTAQVHLHH